MCFTHPWSLASICCRSLFQNEEAASLTSVSMHPIDYKHSFGLWVRYSDVLHRCRILKARLLGSCREHVSHYPSNSQGASMCPCMFFSHESEQHTMSRLTELSQLLHKHLQSMKGLSAVSGLPPSRSRASQVMLLLNEKSKPSKRSVLTCAASKVETSIRCAAVPFHLSSSTGDF